MIYFFSFNRYEKEFDAVQDVFELQVGLTFLASSPLARSFPFSPLRIHTSAMHTTTSAHTTLTTLTAPSSSAAGHLMRHKYNTVKCYCRHRCHRCHHHNYYHHLSSTIITERFNLCSNTIYLAQSEQRSRPLPLRRPGCSQGRETGQRLPHRCANLRGN